MDEDLVERANARLGALLKGKYKLDRVLGIGGMATVYAATHRNGKTFAVKVLHADLSIRSETRTRFLREGYLANKVNHPGAVAVLDDDVSDEGDAFLVMELLDGFTVEALWERNNFKLPLRLVVGVGLQLLDVLAAAHGRGLVHRDIKPANLMLTNEGHLKVLDFGIARLRDMANVRMTQTGMVMGTPAFMAPEHALAKTEEIDAQTDLWAAGATMFTLATGLLVHEADNTQQILVKAATVRARPFAGVMPTAPEIVAEAIDKALEFEKRDRWASATEMQAALREATTEAFGAIPTPAVLAEILGKLSEHSKAAKFGKTEPPPALESVAVPVPSVGPPSAGSASEGDEPTPVRFTVGGTLTGVAPGSGGGPRVTPPPGGLITVGAISTDSHTRRPATKPRGAMIAVVAMGAIGVAGLLFVATRDARPKDDTAAATSVVTPASTASAAGGSTGSPSASTTGGWTAVTSGSSLPAEPHTSAVPLVAVSALAAVHSPPHPASGATTTPGVSSTPATPVTATAAAPVAPSQHKASCNPPYEFDENGNKRWKRECL